MNIQQNAPFSCFDFLYCEEEKWVECEGEEQESEVTLNKNSPDPKNPFFSPLFHVLEQYMFWEDEELESLFRKERESCSESYNSVETIYPFSLARKESVEWILRVNAYHGFSTTTAILAVNYFDRFIWSSNLLTYSKPWMMQLAVVSCLSLAAKVEETHAPLLLDLQVECSECVFDAKTIQKMELLVLSSLKWRMNPVTPLSFLDHIVRRLGMKDYNYIHWEFLRSCENLLLSVISADSRIVHYLPSVLATATMLQVIHRFEPCDDSIDHEKQLLLVLKTRKEQVDDCYNLISHLLHSKNIPPKRKSSQVSSFPNGSNDQWENSSCISSSPSQPVLKKTRVQEQHMKLGSLSSRVFVDAVWSSTR
ncbi:cyclin-D3-2-like isoform X1 [Primulina huaijiensis]|uniref:cyclin-D3-2-like isoform X1 n=1 Tax=Primulina huaijiensis TaxID=1492673 RepID=UPI003CC74796